MKNTSAKKSGAKRKHDNQRPNRKIGRYVLMFVLAIPLFMQLRHLEMPKAELELAGFGWPKFDFPSLDFTRFRLPKLNAEVKITNIVIDGELVFSNREALKAQLSEQLKTDFVRLNLDEIQASLLENPWYRKVSVNRVWPSSLKLNIEEEKPIARWGDQGFVNRYGEVVVSRDIKALQHLPLLMGSVEEAYEIAKSYLTIGQLMVDHKLYITQLQVSESGDWSLEVNKKFSLALGDRDLSSRIERFLFLYEKQLLPLIDDVAMIDMRYRSGVAVKWKEHTPALESADNTIVSR